MRKRMAGVVVALLTGLALTAPAADAGVTQPLGPCSSGSTTLSVPGEQQPEHSCSDKKKKGRKSEPKSQATEPVVGARPS